MVLTALGAVAAVVVGVLLAVLFVRAGPDDNRGSNAGSDVAGNVPVSAAPGTSASPAAVSPGAVPQGSTGPGGALDPSAIPSPQPGATTQTTTAPAQPSAAGASSAPAVSSADLHDRVGGVLETYLEAVNSGDYRAAYAQTSSGFKSTQSYEKFASGLQSSSDEDLSIRSVQAGANGRVTAWVTFTSHQDAGKGPSGQTCTNWSLDYTFVPGGENGLLIDSSRGHGKIATAC